MSILNIKKLHVNVDGKPILNGVDIEVKSGEVHAIMGPNGTGKSTLAEALAKKYNTTFSAEYGLLIPAHLGLVAQSFLISCFDHFCIISLIL